MSLSNSQAPGARISLCRSATEVSMTPRAYKDLSLPAGLIAGALVASAVTQVLVVWQRHPSILERLAGWMPYEEEWKHDYLLGMLIVHLLMKAIQVSAFALAVGWPLISRLQRRGHVSRYRLYAAAALSGVLVELLGMGLYGNSLYELGFDSRLVTLSVLPGLTGGLIGCLALVMLTGFRKHSPAPALE
jgi:hypothetical protein